MLPIICALAMVAETYQLTYSPPLGHSSTYSLKLDYTDALDALRYEMVDEVCSKVVFSDSNGFITVENDTKPITRTLDGQDLPVEDNGDPIKLRQSRSRRGIFNHIEEDPVDPLAIKQISRACSIIFSSKPVGIGDRWTHEYSSDADPGLSAAKTEFRLIGVQEIKGVKIAFLEFNYEEKGGFSAIGKAEVELQNGWTTRLALKAENAQIPGGEGKKMHLELLLAAKPSE